MIVAAEGENYLLSSGVEVPNSILYKGTTYLPIRNVGELLGKEITWNGLTSTAGINDKVTEESAEATNLNKINVKYNNLEMKDGFIIDDRTRVSINDVFKVIGFEIDSNTEKNVFIGKIANKTIEVHVGDSIALVSGEEVSVDTVPVLINSEIYVPIRFIDEIGIPVRWDSETRTVELSYDIEEEFNIDSYEYVAKNSFIKVNDNIEVKITKITFVNYETTGKIIIQSTQRNISGDPAGELPLRVYLEDGTSRSQGGINIYYSIEPDNPVTRTIAIAYSKDNMPAFIVAEESSSDKVESFKDIIKWKAE